MKNSTDIVSLVITGLRKRSQHSTETFEERIELRKDASLEQLWKSLESLGYQSPQSVTDLKGRSWTRNQTKLCFHNYDEVEIVADEKSVGANQIHINEPLIAFTNRGAGLDFGLKKSNGKARGSTETACNVLEVGNALTIKFHRTVRMPDDGKMHHLPASLGLFPLYNVSEYRNRVLDRIAKSGGVFLPIWSREALWMSFHSDKRKFALRIFAGGVNVVTGKTMDESKKCDQRSSRRQDYIVVPGQPWLDGIQVEEGVVRQFVAMPLGSGYTTEGQKTGQEKYGGLQIEVIPEYQRGLRTWLPDNLTGAFMKDILDGILYHGLSEISTPLELHLQHGQKIRSYPPSLTFEKPIEIANLCEADEKEVILTATNTEQFSPTRYDSVSPAIGTSHTRRISKSSAMGLAAGGKLIQDIYRDHNQPEIWNTSSIRIINIHLLDSMTCERFTHVVPPPPPIDTEMYLKANFPFYVVEEQADNRLEGGEFDDVKSVSALDKEKGITTESIFDPSKPTRCSECKIRICHCIIRPCNHTFCKICIKKLEKADESTEGRQCLKCQTTVSHVAGFRAPMDLSPEESPDLNAPISVLKVEDGRVAFRSVQTMRL